VNLRETHGNEKADIERAAGVTADRVYVADRVYCDDGMRSGCHRLAMWWITTRGGEHPMCDQHAYFYLSRPSDVFPRRLVAR
jgi:hypothetical protein